MIKTNKVEEITKIVEMSLDFLSESFCEKLLSGKFLKPRLISNIECNGKKEYTYSFEDKNFSHNATIVCSDPAVKYKKLFIFGKTLDVLEDLGVKLPKMDVVKKCCNDEFC